MPTEFEKTILDKLENLENRLDDYEKKFDKNNYSIKNMKQDLCFIEKELNFVISTKFHEYSMNGRIHGIQHNRLNSLSFKVESHDNRISVLEKNLK